ncbi:MAG: hypothetical protein JJU07_07985 [Natronohydrobacter sp.]|nr:hypothetical protein [Natronohydrobacter sp.]
MNEERRAYFAAINEIKMVKKRDGSKLDLGFSQFSALKIIPNEILEIPYIEELELDNTQISDLSPIRLLDGLERLHINNVPVSDLSPISELERLEIIDIEGTKVKNLEVIRKLINLRALNISDTHITDISPVSAAISLEHFVCENSAVQDLRPLISILKLGTDGWPGLHFEGCRAAQRDQVLDRLSKIDDPHERTRQTLDYLRSLPPWPEPYTPAATADGSPPQPIGGGAVPLDPQATKSQITHLLRNATATRLTAQEFASQIRTALQGVPATDGNRLAEPLQTMLEFADVLDRLAPQSEPATDPLDRAKLELRIAQLETLVARLTRQLHDETTAREAAEALAGKGGFTRSFQQEAGKQVARVVVWVPSVVICTGLYQAATHYLGVGNPVLEGMSRLLLKAGD